MNITPGTVADRIFNLICQQGKITTTEIIETGIPLSSVTACLSRLEKAGLIISTPEKRPRRVFDGKTIQREVKVYSVKENGRES